MASPPLISDSKGVKLPDVLTFDGNILNWRSFWEQFHVSVHNHSSLIDSEKLVYLHATLVVKDSSARNVSESLSGLGENYSEATHRMPQSSFRPPTSQSAPLIPFSRYSSFDHLKRVTAWIVRFIDSCVFDNITKGFLLTL